MKILDGVLEPVAQPCWLRRLMRRLFHYETMSGNGACPVYLERWIISEDFNCGAYLHHFIGDDRASDPHDHPRRFISIGLRGWYWEDTYHSPQTDPAAGNLGITVLSDTKRYRAPWIRSFPAEHLHRVRASECGNTWTLVIVLPKSRPWGFVRDGIWIPLKEYVSGGKYLKSC